MIIPKIGGVKHLDNIPSFLASEVAHHSKSKSAAPNGGPQITKLDNGLTIITETMPHVLSAGIHVFVNVGSVNEDDRISGATHFLEHMVFQGTKNRTEKQIADEAADSGAEINAATSEEYTHYDAQVLGENVMTPTAIFLDMLLNNRMRKKKFEVERGVILEEAKGYEDDPQHRVLNLAQETYYKGHPYGRKIIGTQETISQIQISDLKRFLRDYYTPDNMFVSLAGNFDPDKAIKEIERLTSDTTIRAHKSEIPPLTCNVENVVDSMNIQQAHIILITKGYSLLDDKRYALLVLNQAFGGGMNSRLFRNIRNKTGWCYSVDSFLDLASLGGAFMVYSGLKQDKVQEGISLILKEMDKVKKRGLTPEELNRAKTQIRTALVLKGEATDKISYSNGASYMHRGSVVSLEEVDRKIQAVTNEDIMKVANEVFDPKFTAAFVIGPKKTLPKSIEITL